MEIPEHQVEWIMADVFTAGLHGNRSAWLQFPVMPLHSDCLLGCTAFSLFLPVSRGSLGSREQQCSSTGPPIWLPGESGLRGPALSTSSDMAWENARFPGQGITTLFSASFGLGHINLP